MGGPTSSLDRKHADTMARRRISKSAEQWAIAPYGTLHAPSADNIGTSREEAHAHANKEWAKVTPVRRLVVTIDGVEYGSKWVRVPTPEQRVLHPTWPAEVDLG